MRIRHKIATILSVLLCAVSCSPKQGNREIKLLLTGDVHAMWFDSTYTSGGTRLSLMSVKTTIDSVRNEVGKENTILLDLGDCIQGDNAAFYYNYVDTLTPHIFPRICSYMGYDAVVVGNHDIETGHSVYDRVNAQLKEKGIPFMGGNAISLSTKKPYFKPYKIFKKGGVKIAVLGYTNPNMKSWIPQDLWEGIVFQSLIPRVQRDVDEIIKKEKPHVVIVAAHSGLGDGDPDKIDSQGLALLQTLRGVDLIICSHDHVPAQMEKDGTKLINVGSHCKQVGEATIDVSVQRGKVTSKEISTKLITVDKDRVDTVMRNTFRDDFVKVRDFTKGNIGATDADLWTSDSYKGMSMYMNLIHLACLSCYPAEISIASPISYDAHISPGEITLNDIFSIYPFENRVFVIKMTGNEIKKYLELSYDNWIQPLDENGHVLKIVNKDNPWTGQKGWSFLNRYYVFDSVGGLNYTVDIFKPYGQRVEIKSTADGTPFDKSRFYNVAITSFRLCGGGDLLTDGAGLTPEEAADRVVASYPQVRELMYNYIQNAGRLSPEKLNDTSVLGHWEFSPKGATTMIDNDFALLFGR